MSPRDSVTRVSSQEKELKCVCVCVCGYQMRSAVHILSSYLFHYKLKPPYCPNTDVPFIVSLSKAGDTERTDGYRYRLSML